MYKKSLIAAYLATAICAIGVKGLDDNDVPPECRSVCRPVIDTERRCDDQFDDDDDDGPNGISTNLQYRECICRDPNAAAALAPCIDCTVLYPNFFIDNDDDDNGPVIDVNEAAEWGSICGVPPIIGPNGTLTVPPTSLPTSLTTYSTTVTQTYDCDRPPSNDLDAILDDINDGPDRDEDDPQCTRTAVIPVVGIAGRPGPITSAATNTPAPTRTSVSVSYITGTTTDSAGNAAPFTSAVTSFTGAASLPTAAAGFFGAGAAALVAAFAL